MSRKKRVRGPNNPAYVDRFRRHGVWWGELRDGVIRTSKRRLLRCIEILKEDERTHD